MDVGIHGVSIHAPTWGATEGSAKFLQRSGCFNPRTHVGCDEPELNNGDFIAMFQSTHPRGVRPVGTSLLPSLLRFNPRTHVGCDHIDFCGHGFGVVSIHAPTWGATFNCVCVSCEVVVSIHAPTWGATYTTRRAWRATSFNPRTHVGCDAR